MATQLGRYLDIVRAGGSLDDGLTTIFRDLDLRLSSVEATSGTFEATRDRLLREGLLRINEILLPAFAQVQDYTSIGIGVCPIAEDSEVAFAVGATTLTMAEGTALNLFSPSPFVALTRNATASDWCIARVVDFNRTIRSLALDVISVTGSAGPWSDVSVGFLAGNTIAGQQAMVEAQAARDLARDWAQMGDGQDVTTAGTRSAKHHATASAASAAASAASAAAALVSRNQTQSLRDDTEALKTAASASASSAAASASAAQTWNPSNYFDKVAARAEIDSRSAVVAEGALADGAASRFTGTASGAIGANVPVVLNDDGTISAISFTGSPQVLGATASLSPLAPAASEASGFYDAASGKLVLAFRGSGGETGYGYVAIGTVTAGVIAWGTPVAFLAATMSAPCIRPTATANQVMVTYVNGGASARAEAVIGTISGTTISFGSPVAINANNGQAACGLDAASGRMVILYSDGPASYALKLSVCSISGTTITLSAPVTLAADQSNNDNLGFVSAAGKLVAVWSPNGSGLLTAAVISVSGTTPSAGTALAISSAAIVSGAGVAAIDGTMLVAGYSTAADSRARVVTISGATLSCSAEVIVKSPAAGAPVVVAYEAATDVIGFYANGDCYSLRLAAGAPVALTVSALSYQPSLAFDVAGLSRLLLLRLSGPDYRLHLPTSLVTNARGHIGYSRGAAADAGAVVVRAPGSVVAGLAGLKVGAPYYLDYDGSLVTAAPAEGSGEIGMAVAAGKLMLTKAGPRGGEWGAGWRAYQREQAVEAALAALPVPIADLPSLTLDFLRDVYFVRRQVISADLAAFVAAMDGSFVRPAAAWYFDRKGTLVQAAAGVPRLDHDPVTLARLGYLAEAGRTNVVLHNRDLTQAVWVKSNVAAARTQTGITGIANSATLLTATAVGGTVMQSVSLASSARAQTAYVKRIAGAGAVEMTMDGGATWTAVTVTASWTRVSCPSQTLANPQVGFRLSTSGDQIAVDFVQNEGGTYPTSPIETGAAAVVRPADSLWLPTAAWLGAEMTMLCWSRLGRVNTSGSYVAWEVGSLAGSSRVTEYISSGNGSAGLAEIDGTALGVVSVLGSRPAGTVRRMATASSSAGRRMSGDGAAVVGSATPSPIDYAQRLGVGMRTNNTLQFDGHIQRLVCISRHLDDAQIPALAGATDL